MAMLRRLMLKGFKSIREMDLELRPLNVMIGANGAGKSNLISFFVMLNHMIQGRLQEHIRMTDGARSLLYYGPGITPQIEARLEFELGGDPLVQNCTYSLILSYIWENTLAFIEETLTSRNADVVEEPEVLYLGIGHDDTKTIDQAYDETRILEGAYRGEATSTVFRQLLERCRVYHFHNTRDVVTAHFLNPITLDRELSSNGSNLASFLYRLKSRDSSVPYDRIIRTIRLIAPFFHDFDLQPNAEDSQHILLNWRDTESNQLFGPHQLSDGTLRAICLITLLMQPDEDLPSLIIVDEPELGLHPYASNLIAALFRKASYHTQILISTQSSSFLDHFDPEDIVVVDRQGKESVFGRPDPVALEAWLDEYSLGEVWEKNVIGGGPH